MYKIFFGEKDRFIGEVVEFHNSLLFKGFMECKTKDGMVSYIRSDIIKYIIQYK